MYNYCYDNVPNIVDDFFQFQKNSERHDKNTRQSY